MIGNTKTENLNFFNKTVEWHCISARINHLHYRKVEISIQNFHWDMGIKLLKLCTNGIYNCSKNLYYITFTS